MYQVACPSCGAPVRFRSTASVMAVCEYCRSTLLKDAESVQNLGKMSEVLEDFSPIQIGTSGVHRGRGFTVVGRIQLAYAAGFWNEWYVLYVDGTGGWLSDAGGQYVLSTREPMPAQAPDFASCAPGQVIRLAGRLWIGADVRTARCTGGQGELPFQVGPGYEAKVADYRSGAEFLTLDFSDASAPALYQGEAVSLERLKCQLLRGADAILEGAGRYRGKISSLDCPACGGSVQYVPGLSVHLACPHCHAAVDLSGPKAQVLAAANRMATVQTTLELGEVATIGNLKYTVLGLLRRAETEDANSRWSEYLLYAPGRDFIWLVETQDGWERAAVMNEWPHPPGHTQALLWDRAHLEGREWHKLYQYEAKVVFAAGSFNWRVHVGDLQTLTEFKHGKERLTMEMDGAELTWTRSNPVPAAHVMGWFGKSAAAVGNNAARSSAEYRGTAKRFTWGLIAINAIPVILGSGKAVGFVLLTLLGLWLPAWFLDAFAPDDDE